MAVVTSILLTFLFTSVSAFTPSSSSQQKVFLTTSAARSTLSFPLHQQSRRDHFYHQNKNINNKQQYRQQQQQHQHQQHSTSATALFSANKDENGKASIPERILSTFSTVAAMKVAKKYGIDFNPSSERGLNALTLLRVGIPSVISGIVAFLAFPAMSLWLCSLFSGDPGVFAVLSQDSSQFVQNFLAVAGLLFSILVGQTYYFMYQQQEMVYFALFNEVTEAKSLLEQVALVCQGRSMYPKVLKSISKYVQEDLKKLRADPAVLLKARPIDDPLETIMYLTSVGVPSTVYETVRSLRQARAQRLGALQRKLPRVHMLLLWILAGLELISFPLLGAGTQSIGGYNILSIEGALFGVMTMGIVLTLRIVGELWRPAGGAYNVDNVLKIMVKGLEQELQARLEGKKLSAMVGVYPSGADNLKIDEDNDITTAVDADFMKSANQKILNANESTPSTTDNVSLVTTIASPVTTNTSPASPSQQGGDISFPVRRIVEWINRRRSSKKP